MENRVTEFEQIMKDCTLCPRNCHADRLGGRRGYCGQGAEIMAARAALHFWEEPCISGETGSGTVFFSGCVLRCVYCQNHNIAESRAGRIIGWERLSEIFLELQDKKANNINLVTPTHFVPQIALECRSLQTAHAMAEAGVGVTLVPELFVRHAVRNRTMCYCVMQGHSVVRKLAVTYRSDRYLSEDARVLIGLLQKLLR